MDIWIQRIRFRDLVRQYRLSEGITLAEVAKRVGLEESTLKDYLYRKDVKPSLPALQRAASLFGCSVTEFVPEKS